MVENTLSGYQMMWALVMFDLPVGTKKEVKEAANFRKHLLDLGFEMAQFSVYMHNCNGRDQYEALSNNVQSELPEAGNVEILSITDRQYEDMKRFVGKSAGKRNKNPDQLAFF